MGGRALRIFAQVKIMNHSLSRAITLTLSDLHIRKMIDTHILKEGDADNMEKVAQVSLLLLDQSLGLPEESRREWDDWAKGLE